MLRIATTLLVFAFAITNNSCAVAANVDATAEPTAMSSVARTLDLVSRARQSRAEHKLQLQQQRVDSLSRLYREGFASFRELNDAKVLLTTLQAEYESAKKHRDFVTRTIAIAEASVSSSPPTSSIVIKIPSLANDAATAALAYIEVPPSSQSARALKLQHDIDAEFADHHQSRAQAWSALASRLDEIGLSQASERELRNAELKHQIADAESRLDGLNGVLIHRFANTASFTVDERKIDSPIDWLRLCSINASELSNAATLKATTAQRNLLAEWSRRVAEADRQGAAQPGELAQVNRMMASLDQQIETIKSFASVESLSPPGNAALVSHSPGETSKADDETKSTLQIPARQLAEIRDSVADRLIEASEHVSRTESEYFDANRTYLKLIGLANHDSTFRKEANHSERQLQVAEMNHHQAALEHRLRIQELEYVMARIGPHTASDDAPTPRKTWIKPLIKLFRLQADSIAPEKLAAAHRELAAERFEAMDRLHKSGAATWKERTAAHVNLVEHTQAIERAKANRVAAAAVADLLEQSN